MTPRGRLSLLAALALTACGGGGSSPAPAPATRTLLWPGDSLQSGQIATEPNAPLQYLPVRPAQRAQEALGAAWRVVDVSEAGSLAADRLEAFPGLLAAHRPAAVVLGWGGADALKRTPLADFYAAMLRRVSMTRAAGAVPVLVGMVHAPDPDAESRLGLVDASIALLADQTACLHVDVWGLPAGAIVGGHPDQTYANRRADAIAAIVARIQ